MHHHFSPYVKENLKGILETNCILAIERNFGVLYFIYIQLSFSNDKIKTVQS